MMRTSIAKEQVAFFVVKQQIFFCNYQARAQLLIAQTLAAFVHVRAEDWISLVGEMWSNYYTVGDCCRSLRMQIISRGFPLAGIKTSGRQVKMFDPIKNGPCLSVTETISWRDAIRNTNVLASTFKSNIITIETYSYSKYNIVIRCTKKI